MGARTVSKSSTRAYSPGSCRIAPRTISGCRTSKHSEKVPPLLVPKPAAGPDASASKSAAASSACSSAEVVRRMGGDGTTPVAAPVISDHRELIGQQLGQLVKVAAITCRSHDQQHGRARTPDLVRQLGPVDAHSGHLHTAPILPERDGCALAVPAQAADGQSSSRPDQGGCQLVPAHQQAAFSEEARPSGQRRPVTASPSVR